MTLRNPRSATRVRQPTWRELTSLLLSPPIDFRIQSPLPIADFVRRLGRVFTYRLSWFGTAAVRAWIPTSGLGRSIAGRINGDRVTVVMWGLTPTRFGPILHSGKAVMSARLVPSANGTDLVGAIGYQRWIRVFAWVWFGGLAFFFLPIFLLVTVLSQDHLSAAIGVAAVVGMFVFGVVFARITGRLHDIDARDLLASVANAVEGQTELDLDG
jgi:hypothetical protein